jgi:hypothetical protein
MFDSGRGDEFSLRCHVQTDLGPIQLMKWVPGALSLGIKRLERKLTTHLHTVPKECVERRSRIK